jgi:hypothetical protein
MKYPKPDDYPPARVRIAALVLLFVIPMAGAALGTWIGLALR